VVPQVHQGTIRDIGYHGVLAEMDQELEPHSEIKLALDLSLVGYKATDIYAKVLKTRQQEARYLSALEVTSVRVQSNI
jgi:adenylate cyclase